MKVRFFLSSSLKDAFTCYEGLPPSEATQIVRYQGLGFGISGGISCCRREIYTQGQTIYPNEKAVNYIIILL
jgi:hypothetical protein